MRDDEFAQWARDNISTNIGNLIGTMGCLTNIGCWVLGLILSLIGIFVAVIAALVAITTVPEVSKLLEPYRGIKTEDNRPAPVISPSPTISPVAGPKANGNASTIYMNSNSYPNSNRSMEANSKANTSSNKGPDTLPDPSDDGSIRAKSRNTLTSPKSLDLGTLTSTWVNINAVENGQDGIKIHAKIETRNTKYVLCKISAYFYYSNGNPIPDQNNRYASDDGAVAVTRRFTPPHDATDYKDFTLFMPNSELDVPDGTYNLYYKVAVYTESGEMIGESAPQSFTTASQN